jgi:hypothetical protein
MTQYTVMQNKYSKLMTVIYKTIDLKHNLHKQLLAHITIINIITDCIILCHKSNHLYNYLSKNFGLS